MRVLLLAHAYPPYPASGSRRARHLVRALVRVGHQVDVLTAELPTASSGGEPAARPSREEGVRVYEVAEMPAPATLLTHAADLAGRMRVGGSEEEAPPSVDGPAPWDLARILEPGPAWRRWVRAVLLFPGDLQGFLLPAVRCGLRSAQAGADMLYTTGPPVVDHLAGLCIHGLSGLPWVAEFRDPWIVDGVPYRRPALRAALTDAVERALYRRCLAAAAEVVAVTESVAEVLARDRPGPSRHVHVVRNGIPRLEEPGPRRGMADATADGIDDGPVPPRTIRLVHLGAIYGFRDPRPLVRAVAELREAGHPLASRVRLDFVGAADDGHLRRRARVLGLGDAAMRVKGWVPHEEGQDLLREAHLAVLLAQRQPLQVPNKLYEYLGHRKPILAFADAEGETARMLRVLGGHHLVTERDSPDEVRRRVARSLEAAWPAGSWEPDPRGTELLCAWTTERQMEAVADIVEAAQRP